MMADHKVVPILISIEGNIASGKSTGARALQAENKNIEIVQETVSTVGLELFQKDPKTFALPFQLETLLKRHYDIQLTLRCAKPGITHVVLDRSAPGDYLFERVQCLDGNISDDGHRMYMNAASVSGTQKLFQSLNMILYLHTEPERCEQSVKKRGNVDANTRLEYLYNLDHMHIYWIWYQLLTNADNITIRIVDWRHFGSSEKLWKAIQGPSPRLLRVSDQKDVPPGIINVLDYRPTSEAVKSVWVAMDDHLEALPPSAFPKLEAKYRFVHKQAIKNLVNNLLSLGTTVYMVGVKLSFLDSFLDSVL